MPHGIETRLIETVTPMVRELVATRPATLADLHYADVRLEVTEGKFAGAENGETKSSGDDYAFALGIRVLAGDRMTAPGYFGRGLGRRGRPAPGAAPARGPARAPTGARWSTPR